MKVLTHYLGGKPRPGEAMLEQRDPSDQNSVVSRLPEAEAALVSNAIDLARDAAESARGTGIEARADFLERWAATLAARSGELAELIALETGKVITDARGEVGRAVRIARFFAGEALRNPGEYLASTRPGVDVMVDRQPRGVVGVITPWNFPIAIPVWKIAPALAFGNVVVWKPSEHSSMVADAIMQAAIEAEVPAGLLSIVLGGGETGRAMVAADGLDAVSFTGSQTAGKHIAGACSARFIPVQLEMGGINSHYVGPSADVDAAARAILDAAFFSAGQRCTATSRIFVDQEVARSLEAALGKAASQITLGNALDANSRIGPLVSARQKAAYEDAVAQMEDRGRETVVRIAAPDRDCFVSPVIYRDAQPGDAMCDREVFGPCAALNIVAGVDEAIGHIRTIPYALSSGISSNDHAEIAAFKRGVRTGMVMVNLPTAGVDYHVPFGGGTGASYGPREQGRSAAEFYTRSRTIYELPG